MPHYDYRCDRCGHQEEVFQKITACPLESCPNCQQATFRRKTSGGIGLQFQGSGFYINDYDPQRSSEKPSPSSGGCGCGKTACETS